MKLHSPEVFEVHQKYALPVYSRVLQPSDDGKGRTAFGLGADKGKDERGRQRIGVLEEPLAVALPQHADAKPHGAATLHVTVDLPVLKRPPAIVRRVRKEVPYVNNDSAERIVGRAIVVVQRHMKHRVWAPHVKLESARRVGAPARRCVVAYLARAAGATFEDEDGIRIDHATLQHRVGQTLCLQNFDIQLSEAQCAVTALIQFMHPRVGVIHLRADELRRFPRRWLVISDVGERVWQRNGRSAPAVSCCEPSVSRRTCIEQVIR